MSLRITTPFTHELNATQALKRASLNSKEHLRRALSSIEKDSFRYQHDVAKKPWLEEGWSWLRIQVAQIVRSQSFETLMGFVILVNLALMVIETNADASCYPDYSKNTEECPSRSSLIEWLQYCNIALLVTYTLECAFRAFVERKMYVCNTWNLIDFFTMIAGWCSIFLASVVNLSVLRIFRVARLVRLGRLMISVPELYVLVSGLSSSFKAILFGSLLLVAVIVVWSVIVVEFLHPVNVEIEFPDCERCPRGFQTVFAASLTLFSQIVAGDQWSSISVPLAEYAPWTAPMMFFMMTTISLGVMNLILAVIVEKAAEARANNKQQKKMAKESEREARMVDLAVLCDLLDEDGNGRLSLDEMLQGFDSNEKFFALMQHMDISRGEVEVVFNVLSGENSEVDYMEFCQHLSAFNKRDPLMIQSLIKYSVMELRHMLKKDVMEALKKQNEMLEDHLKLIAHVPSCAEAAKDLQKKRSLHPTASSPAFRSTPLKPLSKTAMPEDLLSWASNLDQVGETLEAACLSFQHMDKELNELIEKTESIPQSVFGQASTVARQIIPVLKTGDTTTSLPAASFPSNGSVDSLAIETGARFKDVVMDFHQRMQRHREREEELLMRSREALQALSSLMHSDLLMVKQEL